VHTIGGSAASGDFEHADRAAADTPPIELCQAAAGSNPELSASGE
jgi:hypothetical protein